jgi:hypothetical protein
MNKFILTLTLGLFLLAPLLSYADDSPGSGQLAADTPANTVLGNHF